MCHVPSSGLIYFDCLSKFPQNEQVYKDERRADNDGNVNSVEWTTGVPRPQISCILGHAHNTKLFQGLH